MFLTEQGGYVWAWSTLTSDQLSALDHMSVRVINGDLKGCRETNTYKELV